VDSVILLKQQRCVALQRGVVLWSVVVDDGSSQGECTRILISGTSNCCHVRQEVSFSAPFIVLSPTVDYQEYVASLELSR
jgi:hypothetical protein